ncbi:MAG: thioesterase family protein [Melioribacteraceae bacterium]|nr:thioesterase family protein [Melioribacteraceae bacterium]
MISNVVKIRVRYADTDKMQFVYNGKYLEYFEVGRTELLRAYGLPYSEIEKEGFQLPLIEAGLKFKNPAYYDDILNVEATVKTLNSAKVHIEYKIFRDVDETLLVEGFTSHLFINLNTKKPVKPPKIYLDNLNKYF